MRWFSIRFGLDSSVISTWQSDTIWGHLCWIMKYLYGDEALADFLGQYEKGYPPLLVSNGFPEEFLPRLIMPTTPIDRTKPLQKQREEFSEIKETRQMPYLTLDDFNHSVCGTPYKCSKNKPAEHKDVILKNQINRLTGTTGGDQLGTGQLFSMEQYRWDSVTIYLKTTADFFETAKELFHNLALSGYGKRKSVGYGQLSILRDLETFEGFNEPADANGFVSLSNFIPAKDNPVTGYWEPLVKYGKLGEDFATSENPFKRPLIMFKAGSTFFDSQPREFYGHLVDNVISNRDANIVQYGFALPVKVKLDSNFRSTI